MSTSDEDVNGTELVTLHDVIEEAPVTRSVALANAFCEAFCDEFAEAELSADKKFLMMVGDFDHWLIEAGAMPVEVEQGTKVSDRGRNVLRREARATINRAAAFGKAIWPPFSIDVQQSGLVYEVSLLEYFADRIPGSITTRMRRYLTNKHAHWGHISKFMHGEEVEKRAPEVALRFRQTERSVVSTLKRIEYDMSLLDEELRASHREARRVLALARKKPDDDSDAVSA